MNIIDINTRKPWGMEISGLENAPIGYVATVPGRPELGTAHKVDDGGRTWLHELSGDTVTTYMIYSLGFRAPDQERFPDPIEEADCEVARDHVRRLVAAGMTFDEIAEAVGVTTTAAKEFSTGKTKLSRPRHRPLVQAYLSIPMPDVQDVHHAAHRPFGERLAELEWLLENRVPLEDAVARCGLLRGRLKPVDLINSASSRGMERLVHLIATATDFQITRTETVA